MSGNVEVKCTRIVVKSEPHDHARDIDYTRSAVRHVQFRIMSTHNGRGLAPSVMLLQWTIFPTIAIVWFKQEGGWVTVHRTKIKKNTEFIRCHILPLNLASLRLPPHMSMLIDSTLDSHTTFCLPTNTLKAKSLPCLCKIQLILPLSSVCECTKNFSNTKNLFKTATLEVLTSVSM